MACVSFEDRLLDYDELDAGERALVDAHLHDCGECREYLNVLAAMDAGLTRLYAGAQVSHKFRAPVVTHKVSWVPELLDFIGWAAVIAFAIGAALLFVPAPALIMPASIVSAAVAALAASWICMRSFAELHE